MNAFHPNSIPESRHVSAITLPSSWVTSQLNNRSPQTKNGKGIRWSKCENFLEIQNILQETLSNGGPSEQNWKGEPMKYHTTKTSTENWHTEESQGKQQKGGTVGFPNPLSTYVQIQPGKLTGKITKLIPFSKLLLHKLLIGQVRIKL